MTDPVSTLIEIKALSNRIVHLHKRRDNGEFKSVADAVALQRAMREQQRLIDALPPLRLAASN